MKNLLLVLSALLFLNAPVYATMRAVPLVNPAPVKVATFNTGSIKAEQVRAAIIAGGQQHNWTVKSEQPGKLVLALNVRNKHFLEVGVSYSETGYAVTYLTSERLEYTKNEDGTELIHPSFNRWMNYLTSSINTILVSLPSQK